MIFDIEFCKVIIDILNDLYKKQSQTKPNHKIHERSYLSSAHVSWKIALTWMIPNSYAVLWTGKGKQNREKPTGEEVKVHFDCLVNPENGKKRTTNPIKSIFQKYLFDHYLHFLKLHIMNNYINPLFIWSRRLPLRPHLVAGTRGEGGGHENLMCLGYWVQGVSCW